VRCAVDQQKGDGGGGSGSGGPSGGGSGSGGGPSGGGVSVDGGIQDETDSTWISVITAAAVPVELGLQSEETTFVCLKLLEECHRSSTSCSAIQIH